MRNVDISALPSVTASESQLGAVGWIVLFVLFIGGYPLLYAEAVQIGLNDGLAAMQSHFQADNRRGTNFFTLVVWFLAVILAAGILFFRRIELKLDNDQLTVRGGVRRARTFSVADISKVESYRNRDKAFSIRFIDSWFGVGLLKSWKNSDEFLYRLYQLRPDAFEEGLLSRLRARYPDN